MSGGRGPYFTACERVIQIFASTYSLVEAKLGDIYGEVLGFEFVALTVETWLATSGDLEA